MLMSSVYTYAQIGMGIDQPAVGVLLHIEDVAAKSGVLFPNTALTDLTQLSPFPAGTPEGTLVYNTNDVIGAGYYYWTQTKWQRLNANYGAMAKYVNTKSYTSENIHRDVNTAIRIMGEPSTTPAFNDDIEVFSRHNTKVLKVLVDGRYQVTVNVAMTAIQNPAQVEIQLRINDNDQGAFYRSSEMLATSSSSEDGNVSFTQTLQLKSGDELRVISRKTDNSLNGHVYLRGAGSSSFFIEKLL